MSTPSFEPVRKFVRAGAGAGKTWNLTRQVVSQALEYRRVTGQWPKTVLTTFTRKATQELKGRLLTYCLQEKPEALEFVQSTSYLQITTMHGLFNLFLRRNGFSLGLPNRFQIVSRQKADFWRRQILKDMIGQEPNLKRLQAFDFRRLLSNLKVYEKAWWAGGVRPLQESGEFENLMTELCLPIKNDLRQIIDAADLDGEKWQSYFKGLEQVVACLGAKEPWESKRATLSKRMAELNKPRKSKNNPGLDRESDEQLKDALGRLTKWTTEPEYSSEYWPEISACLKEFDQFANDFMNRLFEKKRSEAALEPDDLEFLSLKILREKPSEIESFSAGFDAWFIDEFQDTSPLQLMILEKMIGQSSCYIVGDPQQSIYLFRGSRSEVFFGKQESMQAEASEFLFLTDNYRSQENLLGFFNDFFPSVSSGFSPMDPKVEPEAELPAVVISHVDSKDESIEVAQITGQVRNLMDRGVSPKEICILTRTHRETDRLQKKLMALGFPVISHSSSNFYRRREILDGLGLLSFLLNPWDDKNLVSLLRSPWVAMKDQDIVKVIGSTKENYWSQFKTYFTQCPEFEPGTLLMEAQIAVKNKGLSWVFRKLIIQLGLLDYSHQIDSTGRREANLWKLINLVEKNAREPGASLLQLVKEGASTTNLEDFADGSDASSPVEPNKINLMTIHSSKGLQFPYIFLPFLHKKPQDTKYQEFTIDEDRNLWSMRLPLVEPNNFVGGILESLFLDAMKKREAEESLRVFYVAMTRAQSQLYLSWTGKPQKKAWAQLLEGRWSEFEHNQNVILQKVTEAKEALCQWESLGGEVRPPFQDESRFPVVTPAPGSEIQRRFQDWHQIKSTQSTRRRGVILHRVFEALKNHDVEKTKRLAERWLHGQSDSVAAAIDYILCCESVPFARIIKNGFVEWGFQKQVEDQVVEGRVDLWGIVDEKLWIVDYKTGSTDFKDQAFLQLQEYAKTLRDYLSWENSINLVAAFPFAEQIYVEEY